MPHKSYRVKQVFKYDTHVKNLEKILAQFSDVAVPHLKTTHTVVNKFTQTGLLLDKKEPKQNTECWMWRYWIELMLGLSINFKNPLHVLHRRARFKISNCKFEDCSVSKKKVQHMNVGISWVCKEYVHSNRDHSQHLLWSGWVDYLLACKLVDCTTDLDMQGNFWHKHYMFSSPNQPKDLQQALK